MQGRDLASLSKQDEERMLKAVEEKNTRDRKADDEKNRRMNNIKNDNLSFLRQQMLEKEQKIRLNKIEDDALA